MALAVRRVSVVDDRQEILDILHRNFGVYDEARFQWRHASNPAGESWTWFLYERGSNITAAMATVFPRYLYIDGKLLVCGQVGEFAVESGHRSLGPAVLMQRTTFDPVNSGALAMCYDCPPHDQGMSTFARLGMPASCEVIRYALPLRSDEYLRKRVGGGWWTKPVIAMANLALKARRRKRFSAGLEICELEGRFDEEFSHLDRLVPTLGTVRSSRSAELLNWRYMDNPGSKSRILVARRGKELLGFLAFWIEFGNAYIVDIFGLDLSDVGTALLATAIEVNTREKVNSLCGFCSAESELKILFESFGFRPRERAARVVAYEKPGVEANRVLKPWLRWPFCHPELMV